MSEIILPGNDEDGPIAPPPPPIHIRLLLAAVQNRLPYGVLDCRYALTDSKRGKNAGQNGGQPVDGEIRLSVGDDLVKALRGKPEDAAFDLLLVAIPGELRRAILAADESRIVTPA